MKQVRVLTVYGALVFLSGITIPEECIELLGEFREAGPVGVEPTGEIEPQSGTPDVNGDVLFYFTGTFTDTCSGFLGHDGDSVGSFWECNYFGEGSGQGSIDDSGNELSGEMTLFPHGVGVQGPPGFNFVINLQGQVSGGETYLEGTWSSPSFSGATGDFVGLRRADLSGLEVTWGDSTCSDSVDPTSVLNTLKYLASAPIDYEGLPCPFIGIGVSAAGGGFGVLTWGDVDCSGTVAATDALGLLLDLGGQDQSAPQCPIIGDKVLLD